MKVEFLREAEEELLGAVEWYELRVPGIGKRLRDEIGRVVARIAEDPLLWRERSGGYRRVNLPVFPYYIAYFVRGETILVAAVAHGHRRPGYWKSRVAGEDTAE